MFQGRVEFSFNSAGSVFTIFMYYKTFFFFLDQIWLVLLIQSWISARLVGGTNQVLSNLVARVALDIQMLRKSWKFRAERYSVLPEADGGEEGRLNGRFSRLWHAQWTKHNSDLGVCSVPNCGVVLTAECYRSCIREWVCFFTQLNLSVPQRRLFRWEMSVFLINRLVNSMLAYF